MDLEKAKREAKRQIEEEEFQAAVEEWKIKFRAARWWHKFFPWKLLIVRRDK